MAGFDFYSLRLYVGLGLSLAAPQAAPALTYVVHDVGHGEARPCRSGMLGGEVPAQPGAELSPKPQPPCVGDAPIPLPWKVHGQEGQPGEEQAQQDGDDERGREHGTQKGE